MNLSTRGGFGEEPDAAQRRELTVLFCDLVDSTEFASRVDPEDFRELVHRLNAVVSDVVGRYGGRIATFLGDGALATFGFPLAHDDDARRAVMAGIEIVRQLTRLDEDALAARIAVHTGPVVVGDFRSAVPLSGFEILGLTTNVAARLQGVADRNSVIVSATTAELVSGYFELESLGEFSLKGVSQPTQAFRPVASHDQLSRFDLAVTRGLSPFVGRDADLDWLRRQWADAVGGRAATALLVGEPGVGKTRLAYELRREVSPGCDVVELRGSAMHTNQPLYPVLGFVRANLRSAAVGAGPEDAAAASTAPDRLRALADELTSWLRQSGLADGPEPALLADLLHLPLDSAVEPPASVELRRAQTLDALRVVLGGWGDPGRPLLVVLEDAHWADPTTLELLGSLTARPIRATLALATARPEFEPPWDGVDLSIRRLDGLPDGAARDIADWLGVRSGRPDLVEEVREDIVRRAGGVPLFIEEITAFVAEADPAHASPATAIPTNLTELLISRFDRATEDRRLLQIAAVIGRTFDVDLLSTVLEVPTTSVERKLKESAVADLLAEQDGSQTRRFAFRHSLIRDAVYSTLLRKDAAGAHGRVAEALVAGAADDGDGVDPGLVAYHYREAGMVGEAVEYYLLAATTAVSAGANTEALKYLEQADALVVRMPAGPERLMSELGVLVVRGPTLMAQRGFGHPAVAATFHRAKEICDAVPDPVEMFPVLYGLFAYSLVRCELDAAAEISATLLAAAQQQQDAGMAMLAHAATAQTLFIRGSFGAAARHAALCRENHDPVSQADYRVLFGEDPGTVCASVEFSLTWLLGRPTAALRQAAAAIELARTLQHPFTLAETLLMAARLHHYLGDHDALRAVVAEAGGISDHHGFDLFTAEAGVWTGWLAAVGDGDAAGPETLSGALDAFRASGAEMFICHHLGLLAEARWQTGDVAGAIAALDEARAQAATGSLDHYVEVLRLSAVLRGQSESWSPEVERLFDEAGSTAREQQALSLDVRVAVSRLRLAQELGLPDQITRARDLLGSALAALPDDAGSVELTAARALCHRPPPLIGDPP